jgi:Zn-dependent peptidase ImmA (M78 family)
VETDGFEGPLIRASDVPLGAIVVRESIRRSGRRNFTIAHEIGHFVVPGHDRASLACTAADVANWADHSDAKAFKREADEFGAELLIPAAGVKRIIKGVPPSLGIIEKIARGQVPRSLPPRGRIAISWRRNGPS